MLLRRAVLSDVEDLRLLFRETVLTINVRDYTLAQVQAWAAAAGEGDRFPHRVEQQHVVIIEQHGKMVGFASLEGDSHVDMMYVHREHQRCGIGSRLLNELLREAASRETTLVTVDASLTARPFFERHGFHVAAEQSVNLRGVDVPNFKMLCRPATNPRRRETLTP